MIGARKQFSGTLYRENDMAAKIAWKNYLINSRIIVTNDYGPDVIFRNYKAEPSLFELEVKHNWLDGTFPFRTLHIPERKERLIAPNTWFCVLSKSLNNAMVVSADQLNTRVCKDTRYSRSEYFFEIPSDECKLLQLGVSVT